MKTCLSVICFTGTRQVHDWWHPRYMEQTSIFPWISQFLISQKMEDEDLIFTSWLDSIDSKHFLTNYTENFIESSILCLKSRIHIIHFVNYLYKEMPTETI